MTALSENPTSVRVRKIEPWVIKTHSNLARNEGISLEEHLRVILKNQALRAQEEFALKMRQRRAEITEEIGTDFPDSAELIRAVRADSDIV